MTEKELSELDRKYTDAKIKRLTAKIYSDVQEAK